MAIFPTLIEKRETYAPSHDFWYSTPGIDTTAGVRVSEKTALKYLTVYACVTLIAGDLARLPLNLYRRRADGGKDLITDHRLYDLLHNAPNPDTTSFNWREVGQGHLLQWGNFYSYVERDRQNKILALWQLPDPGAVEVRRRGNEIIYQYYADGEKKTRRRNEIFHVPGFGFNGLYGLSMITLAREAIGMGLAAEEFGARFFGQGMNIGATVSIEHDLGDSEKEYKAALRAQYEGLKKSHGVLLLQNGEVFTPIKMSLEDQQFLETRDHQKIEICGMYHVPPHKIAIHGQNSNYNNLEQENASYVDSCLMHWIVRWESAISLQLLTEQERRSGLFFEFLVTGLLRGDSAARADYYNKLFQVGAMSPNKILAKENENPIEGGDQHFVMLNMVPLDQAGKIDVALPGDEPKELPKPEDEDEKASLRSFFGKARAKARSERRSIMMRDRIARQYRPLILGAAQTIVNRETKAIKKHIANRQARGEADAVGDFLNNFYDKFPEYINQKMGPVLRSYLQAIVDASMGEVDVDDMNLDTEIQAYVESYAERHTTSSLGQMIALLEGDLTDLDNRADEWQERRPEKIVKDESVRASSAAFSWVAFGAGFSLIWRIRGPKTCPYCQELNGQSIKSGQSFVKGGDEIDPKGGDGPMRFFGTKLHPPLHQGCDCYVSSG